MTKKNKKSKASDDDFIMTIKDDEVIEDLDGNLEDLNQGSVKNSKSALKKGTKKSKVKQEDNFEEINPDFNFDFLDDNISSTFNTMEFEAAKATLKPKSNLTSNRTTIDQKISHHLSKGNDKKRNFESEDEDDNNDEDIKSESDDENIESEESEIEISEQENDSDEVEKESDKDSDEESETEEQKERKRAYFAPEDQDDSEIADTFASMNLSRPILKGLSSLGFSTPTPIQARAIPIALMGKDVCGGAVTGSGKTAAFIVPILERLLYRPKSVPLTRVLILCPTRELAMQCHNVAVKISAFTDVTFCLCVGGLPLKSQEVALKERPDFVIATPGRLIDHIRNSASFSLDTIEILVMDEADRMLEDGFAEELNEIIRACPKDRQTMLFSATMTDNVDELIRLSLKKPVRLMIDSSKTAAKRLVQEFVRVRSHREDDRAAMLLSLCRKFKTKCIIFFRSKAAAHQMKIVFGLMSLNAAELHGNLSQEQRIKALEDFRDNKVDYLLATDLAARGLDIQGVDIVINYNMPTQFAQYLHRVGRTARAGRAGKSISLIGESDRKILKSAIKSTVDKNANPVKQRNIPQEQIEKYSKKLLKLKPKIEAILKEEIQEKMLSKAEMEINKAENIIKHQTEIKARPARTWFQSNVDKKKAAIKNSKEFKKQSSN